ncbi:MAG: putative manganese transporter [Armatimonadota bacterium]
MLAEIWTTILDSAANAFLQVGVFVGALLLFFGYLNYRTAGGIVAAIERHRRWQPLIGAAFGVMPGCGGAIFVMPLFMRGIVTYGTLVATLISTMGDSSFVIIAMLPKKALLVHGLSFVVGVLSGYAVDALGLGRTLIAAPAAAAAPTAEHQPGGEHYIEWEHIGHQEGDEVDLALHPEGPVDTEALGYRITHQGHLVYWIVVAVGFVCGVVILTQRSVNDWLGFNLDFWVGLAGTLLSLGLMIAGRKYIGDDTHAESEEKLTSLRETLIHNAGETAFVTTWVFAAYAAYEIVMLYVGEEALGSLVASAGVLSVVAAAAVGLIPGCGPQILLVTLYCRGQAPGALVVIPFAAVLANAISQDGDALFPIIAMHRQTALWATVTTTVPAMVIGLLFYALLPDF